MSPLDAVALKVMGGTPNVTAEAGAKETVCVAALITTFALADANAKLAFPACVAVNAQLPAPTMVS